MTFNNINAFERGSTAFNRGKPRQPMNDKRFVSSMTNEVVDSDEVPKTVKEYYIAQWKSGWDDAKNAAEASKPPARRKKKGTKGKKKVAKKKAKK